MNDIDVLSKQSRFTMAELRAQRSQLMSDRIDLIERYRRSCKGKLVRPYLETVRVPTARKPEEIRRQYDHPWIRNIVVEVVYRAVRKVEVDIPYGEKVRYYTNITDGYVNLISNVIDNTVKTNAIAETADSIWQLLLTKEVTSIVRQCIGELDMAESTAGNIILQAILSVNRKLNTSEGDLSDHHENEEGLAKNIMKEIALERGKRKTVRLFHRLPTIPLSSFKGVKSKEDDIILQDIEDAAEAVSVSGVRHVDIRSLEKRYLPIDFAKYVDVELKVWKNAKVEKESIHYDDVVSGFYVSPRTKLAIVTMKNNIILVGSNQTDTLGKLSLPQMDFIHCSWSESERNILLTTDKGSIYCIALYAIKDDNNNEQKSRSHGNHRFNPLINQSEMNVPISVLWSVDSPGLVVTTGVFRGNDKKHIPTLAYFAPFYTIWGEQPIFLVACDNHDILRVFNEVKPSDAVLLPNDVPKFEDIKNTIVSGMKVRSISVSKCIINIRTLCHKLAYHRF